MASKMEFEDLQNQIECDMFSLAKWSPMATEINREEFLGLSFSHHMEILHKTKDIDEVLLCIHKAVTHQWDKYTLRNILKAGIPKQDGCYQRSVRRGMLLGIVVYGMCIDKQPLGTAFVTRHIMQADVETEAAPDEFSAIIVEIPLHIGANAFKLRYGVIFLTGFLG